MTAIKLCISGDEKAGKTTALGRLMVMSALAKDRILIVMENRWLASACGAFIGPHEPGHIEAVGLSDALMMAGIESLHKKFDAIFIDVHDPSELIHIIEERLKMYRPDVELRIVFTQSTDDPA